MAGAKASSKADGSRSSSDILLDSTGELMAERNSVNVTFVDISQHSGLNSALIRYHFGNKSGLYRALLERDAGGAFEELDRLLEADMDAVKKLRHHVRGVIRVYFRFPYLNRLVGALAAETDSELAQYVSRRFTKPIAAAHRAILEQGRREGTFRDIDPMLFYFSFIGACDHLFHARHSLKYGFGIDTIDNDLRRRYADHVSGILLESVLK